MTVPPWWRARSLAERAQDATVAAPMPAAATDRRSRWEAVLPDDAVLAERLGAAGACLTSLDAVLADDLPPRDVREPDWWRWIAETLAPGTRSTVPDGSDAQDADALRGALRLVAPLARRVRARLAEHPAARADAVRLLTHNIAFELAELCRPAVAMELAATRAAERWPAGDGIPRAAALLRSLGRAEDALALFCEHPGLARMVACRAQLAVEAGGELLERLHADLPEVRDALLGGENPGPIERLEPAGDSHDGGRRVVRIGFASGAQVALKPRSLLADLCLHRLLAALEERGFEPGFRALKTLAAGPQHGWQAWAEPGGCDSPAAVARYYRRLGGQLAVLYALRGVDLHQENVLACGEHPVLVDLEGILHPRLGGAHADVVDPEIAETGSGCVLRVGLLPRADVAFGVDIGGLGRDPLGRVEVQELRWVDAGGEARLERRGIELRSGPNAPRLRGEPVRPHEHVDDLATGFADAYRLLLAHRDELLAPGAALAAFADVPIRFILRPTKVYVDLLRRQASDAAALDDGRAREEALNVLWRGGMRRPDLRVAAAAEHHDLWRGDVPKITGTPGSADAHHHALGALEGLLGPHPAPGPEVVRRLDGADLERQVAYLRTAVLAAPAPAAGGGCGEERQPGRDPSPDPSRAGGAPSRAELLAAVLAAARRLDLLALRDDDQAGWLIAVAAPGHPGRVLRAAGPGFADGQAGIALFLACASAATGDADTAALAHAAARRLAAQLDDAKPGDGAETDERRALAWAAGALDGTARQQRGSTRAGASASAARARVDKALRGDWESLTGGVEVPGLREGIAGFGVTWLALLDQIAADAAAAALACIAP